MKRLKCTETEASDDDSHMNNCKRSQISESMATNLILITES
jgi:hypothetical protein